MPTTIQLDSELVEGGELRARAMGTTLDALIEEGLRAVLAERDRDRDRDEPNHLPEDR